MSFVEFGKNIFYGLVVEVFVGLIALKIKNERQRLLALILGTVFAGLVGFTNVGTAIASLFNFTPQNPTPTITSIPYPPTFTPSPVPSPNRG
jgi:uncharacterized membrane protein YeaQ/YmgE (transglycosylase-associated protein family)